MNHIFLFIVIYLILLIMPTIFFLVKRTSNNNSFVSSHFLRIFYLNFYIICNFLTLSPFFFACVNFKIFPSLSHDLIEIIVFLFSSNAVVQSLSTGCFVVYSRKFESSLRHSSIQIYPVFSYLPKSKFVIIPFEVLPICNQNA